jgi:anthranilate phosphoribosyltransferase
MTIAHFIKNIGRGAAGARSLDRAAAQELMAAVLDGKASPLEVGAFVMAMRMKGETLDELCGFLDAVQRRCLLLHSCGPVVVIPSYNGARRLPNLTPLLALGLAQAGLHVLVHGPLHDPARVTTAEILHDLGLAPARHEADVHAAWASQQPAFMATATLCPPLQTLLDVRQVVGLRNAGHTVAKMVHPFGAQRALRLVNFTHPEFGALMSAWVRQERVDALLLRGTEGEPVADPRRQPRMDAYAQGVVFEAASCPAHEGVVSDMPRLPTERDAASTALYVQSLLAGERPMPAPVAQQIRAVLALLAVLAHPADAVLPNA